MYQTKAAMSTCWHNQLRSFRSRSRSFCWPHSDLRHVSHLSARSRRTLAIEVYGRARHRQPLLIAVDLVPDQIGHDDRAMTDRLAERPAGNGADVLLELRDRRAG